MFLSEVKGQACRVIVEPLESSLERIMYMNAVSTYSS
jgi:hypothetical protein